MEVSLPLGVYYPLGVHQRKVDLHLLIKRIYPRFPFVALRKAGSWLEAALLPLFLLKGELSGFYWYLHSFGRITIRIEGLCNTFEISK